VVAHGFFLFAHHDPDADILSTVAGLLERAVEVAVAKMETVSLVAELQQTNADLDLLVNARTRELRKEVEERKGTEKRLRSSLDEKEILLKEVHHRVKNNLQVIAGLLDLQSYELVDEETRETFRESQNRIRTMALIHEALYEMKDLSHVDFSGFIRDLITNLFNSYGIDPGRVDLDVEVGDIDLVVDTAIPCGLIVNELVSNSLKHAFPEDRTGKITVHLCANDDESYTLEVSDDGAGISDPDDRLGSGSIGMQLIRILSEQLGGDYVFKSGQKTVYSMTFKEYFEAGTELY
jgi:two-component sensor histidine kinase